ncbi:30S ribosomal protein S16 [Candidatus Mycoplasma mahonii]|uniref:30S ribosomal protein S16 n=1 Tax=Candidatus Mycoplasma mahonii TaxID=3004105 RepID=UPI00402B4D2D
MVKIRLKRIGSKFNAFYRIIAADARAPRDGRFIEEIGYHNPHTKETFINSELRVKWEKEGAIATETVQNIFKKYDKMSKNGKSDIVVFDKKVKKAKPIDAKIEVTKVETPPAEVKIEEIKTKEQLWK